jgi:hypothetical protein
MLVQGKLLLQLGQTLFLRRHFGNDQVLIV